MRRTREQSDAGRGRLSEAPAGSVRAGLRCWSVTGQRGRRIGRGKELIDFPDEALETFLFGCQMSPALSHRLQRRMILRRDPARLRHPLALFGILKKTVPVAHRRLLLHAPRNQERTAPVGNAGQIVRGIGLASFRTYGGTLLDGKPPCRHFRAISDTACNQSRRMPPRADHQQKLRGMLARGAIVLDAGAPSSHYSLDIGVRGA